MGFFDSSSSTTNVTTTQNAGFSEIAGPAVAIQGEGNTVQLSDQGAIALAGDIAEGAFDQVELAGKNAVESISQAVQAVSESNREESENLVGNVKTVAIFGAIAWAVVQIAKRFG